MRIRLITFLLVSVFSCDCLFPEEKSESVPDRADFFPGYSQFLFHAVVEGCFRDGVDKADLNFIIPDEEIFANFIYNCPVCHACYDGFLFYSYRQRISLQKSTNYDTFGTGLNKEIKAQLAGAPEVRRKAVSELIKKWTNYRIKQMRLNKTEEKALRAEIAKGKKRGDELLASFKKPGSGFDKYYKDWEFCPSCSGAVESH